MDNQVNVGNWNILVPIGRGEYYDFVSSSEWNRTRQPKDISVVVWNNELTSDSLDNTDYILNDKVERDTTDLVRR